MNLNDPLLQFIMQQLAQAEAGGAPPVQGITPALQQGAIPVSSGPMTTVGFPNQPLSVSPERAATLSPLEQQLSQAANNRAFAEPSGDQLAFEQNTLGFLQGINDQNTGVYDRRMQAQALAAKEAADRQAEIDKAQAPKLIDQQIEKMKIIASSTKDERQRVHELDKALLDGIKEIGKSDSLDKQAAMKILSETHRTLRAPQAAPDFDPAKALTGEIDRLRKEGKGEDEIRQQLIAETEQHPEFVDAAKKAIEYMNMTTMLPQRTSKSAPVRSTTQAPAPQQPKQAPKIVQDLKKSSQPLLEPIDKRELAYIWEELDRGRRERKQWTDEQMESFFLSIMESDLFKKLFSPIGK